MKFGTDWTGLFIRGDDAFAYTQALRHLLENAPVDLARVTLMGLVKLLEASNEHSGPEEAQALKQFPDCIDQSR